MPTAEFTRVIQEAIARQKAKANEFPDYPVNDDPVIDDPVISDPVIISTPAPSITDILDDIPAPQAFTVAKLGAEIPIFYGRPPPTGGLIARAKTFNLGLILVVVWCEGEVDAIEAVYSGSELLGGDQVTNYIGTPTQTFNIDVADAYGQADDLPNICYSAIQLRSDQSLNLKAVIRGKKIYDPRIPGTAYSTNPALALADFIDQYTDFDVDWTQAGIAADYCDDIITGSIKRWEIGLALARSRVLSEWIEVLREYANCYVFIDNGTAKIVPDEPAASSLSLTASDIKKGTFKLSKPDPRIAPTQVETDYLLPIASSSVWSDENEWAIDSPTVDELLRITRLDLKGFFRAIHAKRKSTQFLNRATIEDLAGTLEVFDKGVKITKGDVIDITHPYGLTAKDFRVLDTKAIERGRWWLKVREYQSATYSADVVTDPIPDAPDLPDPLAVPDGPALTVSEELWEDEGGRWFSVFKIEFTGLDWPFVRNYRIKVSWATGIMMDQPINSQGVVTHTVQTPPTKQDREYTIEVWVISRLGAASTNPGTAAITGDGKTLIPTNVNQVSLTALEFGQVVECTHDAVGDTDLLGYRWKRLSKTDYDAAGTDAARWGHVNASLLRDRHDSTTVQFSTQPVGTWVYGVRGLDSVGHESAVTAWVEQEVTADNAGSISAAAILNGTAINMHVYENYGGAIGGIKATSARSTDSLIDRFGAKTDPWPTDQTEPFNYGFNFASSIESAEWDTDSDRTGSWAFSAQEVVALGGSTVTKEIMTATAAAYPTFTTAAGQSVQAEARYAKSKHSVAAALNHGFSVRFPVDFSYQGTILKDNITINIPSSPQPHAFTWTKNFTDTPAYSHVLEGVEPVLIAFDGVDKDGGDVRAWAQSGHSTATPGDAVAATIKVTAEGA